MATGPALEALNAGLVDRLLHHAHVVNIRGQTYRLRDRVKTGVQMVPPAKIPAVP